MALLEGLPETALDAGLARARHGSCRARATLVATMRAHGAYTLLVSGGFTFFTERVAADAGLRSRTAPTGSTSTTAALTGTVAEPILGRDAKLDALRRGAAERGIALADDARGRRRRQRPRRCSGAPASASPSAPSRWSRRPRAAASTMAT